MKSAVRTDEYVEDDSSSATPLVLLIDDSPVVRDIVGASVVSWGYRLVSAATYREGRERFDALAPDLVLCDLGLPDGDGIDLLVEMRQLRLDVPIIVLTSDADVGRVLRAIRSGAFDYVIKDQQLELVRRALERGSRQLELARRNAELIEQLAAANERLESTVEARTAELRSSNAQLRAEQRRLREALHTVEETQGQLVQAEKMSSVGRLAAGILHEVNNPLSCLLPSLTMLTEWAEALAQGAPSSAPFSVDEAGEILRDCLAGAESIGRIVADLRTFTRREAVVLTSMSIDAVLTPTLRMMLNRFGREVHVSREGSADVSVLASANHLQQVLLNLLINAAHAIQATGRRGHIIVRIEPSDDFVDIDVLDEGTGIDPAHLDQVIDPFFTTKPTGQGTGMGLSISHTLVGQMGGDLTLSNRPAGGARARVRLRSGEPLPPLDA